MDDLKPCPFCGGKAELFQSNGHIIGHNEREDDVGVRCTVCDVELSYSHYADYKVEEREDDAIERWNTRA